jgi:hypothetical protein
VRLQNLVKFTHHTWSNPCRDRLTKEAVVCLLSPRFTGSGRELYSLDNDGGLLRKWGRDLKIRQAGRVTTRTMSFKWLSIASPESLSNWACTTEMECRKAVLMSEPRIKDLRRFALFLPFPCIERRQLAASRCKAKTLEVVDKTKRIGLYG